MDLRLTKDNLRDTINKDVLGRNSDIKKFINILDECEENMVFAINGAWGCGKTFFIKQLCLILDFDYIRGQGGAEDEEYEKIAAIMDEKEGLRNLELRHEFIPIYYDAWLFDDHDDPLLSLIYTIRKTYRYIGGGVNGEERKDFELRFGKVEMLTSKGFRLFDVEEAEKIRDGFRDLLGELFKVKPNEERERRIVIVIDELDRCRPDYAIKVLERIKHFVDCEKVFFIYCLNKVELCKSIERFYGSGLESTIYLNKFFDVTYDLNVKDVPFYFLYVSRTDRNQKGFNRVALGMVDYLKFSLRECNQYAEMMKNCLVVSGENGVHDRIVKKVLYPIMIGLRISDAMKCQDFVSGRGKEYLAEVFANVSAVQVEMDEILGPSGQQESKANKRRKEKVLEEVYDSFFANESRGNSEVRKIREELHGLLYGR